MVGLGSPYIAFQDPAQMAELVRAMQAEGAQIANSHTTGLRGVGIKAIGERELAFKREMDPHNLLNPGQMETESASALPTAGWRFRKAG
ncbi:hypothetical protein [Falsiroseomonas sp.]|uniref:hypothetical protein n=1 Tax=Falsiroseomonas sp. TaxID=2870721 RepID=UPI003F720596